MNSINYRTGLDYIFFPAVAGIYSELNIKKADLPSQPNLHAVLSG